MAIGEFAHNGQTLAQIALPCKRSDFCWLMVKRLLLPDLLMVENGWYTVSSWRNAGFSTADERLSQRAAAAGVWGLWLFGIASEHRAQVIPAVSRTLGVSDSS